SVGSVMALTGTIMAGMMINLSLQPIIAILIGIILGIVIGYINGTLTAYARIPSIIVTLAMMEIARGVALLYTGGYPLTGMPNSFSFIGNGYFFKVIPVPAAIMVVVFIIAYIILNHLPFGRHIYAIGGNEEAARLSGIKVNKYKSLIFL